MKTLKVLFAAVLLFGLSNTGIAQNSKKTKEITIKVSSQCEMCKDRIEEALAFEKGVKKSEVDLEKDVVKITYKTKKTSPEKLRKIISGLGYDADNIPADKVAYSKLPGCCKKPSDSDHEGHKH